ALITGAGQGLGRAIAREYADEGATVALVERNQEALERTRAEIAEQGGQAAGYALDVTDYDAYGRAIADVVARFGRLDVLVNNAAICVAATILEDRLEDWRRQHAVNLEAVYMGTKLAAPAMIARTFGRIVNVTSINAFVSSGRWAAYDATKGAIVAFTKATAVELAPYGILVNAIAPGFMRTPMSVVDGVDETETEEFHAWYVEKRHVPLARAGAPEDVAGTSVFRASQYCRYLTGQVLVVDGGLT